VKQRNGEVSFDSVPSRTLKEDRSGLKAQDGLKDSSGSGSSCGRYCAWIIAIS
jgi:hypothetical protein